MTPAPMDAEILPAATDLVEQWRCAVEHNRLRDAQELLAKLAETTGAWAFVQDKIEGSRVAVSTMAR